MSLGTYADSSRAHYFFTRKKNPMIVFLSETWPNEAWLERIRCRLCFDGKFVVKDETQRGGLVLLK